MRETKDMKKVAILLIALMAISVGFLSGCNESSESSISELSISELTENSYKYIEQDAKIKAYSMQMLGNSTKTYPANDNYPYDFPSSIQLWDDTGILHAYIHDSCEIPSNFMALANYYWTGRFLNGSSYFIVYKIEEC